MITVKTSLIKQAHDYIAYEYEGTKRPHDRIFKGLKNLLAENEDKETLEINRDLLNGTISWIHYDRRGKGADCPLLETELRKTLTERK